MVADSLASEGSLSPFSRGKPRLPLRPGGSPYSAASLRSRVVQVTRAREFLQLAVGIGGVGDHVDGLAGQRFGQHLRHAARQHGRDAEDVSLITSSASTGIATGLVTSGSRTTTAAITQLLPYPVFAGPGAEPSCNQPATHLLAAPPEQGIGYRDGHRLSGGHQQRHRDG